MTTNLRFILILYNNKIDLMTVFFDILLCAVRQESGNRGGLKIEMWKKQNKNRKSVLYQKTQLKNQE